MSIKKVAHAAGVSIATVSRFFNNPNQVSKETREKVQQAIKRLNYTPNTLAQNLRRGKTGLIIAVIPKISSPRYESLIKQLNKSANDNGYTLLVKEAEFNSLSLDYYQNMIRCKQADGFILLVGLPKESAHKIDSTLPIVLISEPHSLLNGNRLSYLSIDYCQAVQEATEYFISLGHSSIAFIANNYSPLTISEQQKGFSQAMTTAGLSLSGRIIPSHQHTLNLQEKLRLLLGTKPTPTAIFCADDYTAIESLHWIKAEGMKIPDDISVIGFNDTRYTEITSPPLTTIKQPMDVIGAEAMALLYKLIDGQPTSSDPTTYEHKLIIRNSTSPITS